MGAAFVDLGRAEYASTWALQRRLVDARIAGEVGDVVLAVEHPPVVTLGRKVRGEGRDALAGVPVFEVERGGDLTYHGPGQLVVYPILALPEPRRDIGAYLRALEGAIIRAAARFGVCAERRPPHTGVWVAGRKLASIGVAMRSWVTYHGLALNVTDEPLAAFAGLRPCGLEGSIMTSLQTLAGRPPSMASAREAVRAGLADELGLELAPAPARVLEPFL